MKFNRHIDSSVKFQSDSTILNQIKNMKLAASKTSKDLPIRHLIRYWNGALVFRWVTVTWLNDRTPAVVPVMATRVTWPIWHHFRCTEETSMCVDLFCIFSYILLFSLQWCPPVWCLGMCRSSTETHFARSALWLWSAGTEHLCWNHAASSRQTSQHLCHKPECGRGEDGWSQGQKLVYLMCNILHAFLQEKPILFEFHLNDV